MFLHSNHAHKQTIYGQFSLLTFFAVGVGVSLVAPPARADRDVVVDAALGVHAAGRGLARVLALLQDARQVAGAVGIHAALGLNGCKGFMIRVLVKRFVLFSTLTSGA